ncbi:MAG TPA: lipid-A-disaccharide synthase [Myxococcaceae bacterium]|nr:lipid-A-disaccharide synthase [Myxococcaceae bacterium]
MANGELMVVAGEASGDLHAADVLAALRRRRPGLRAFGMGGPKLKAAGLERLFDAREISVMGIAEVWPRLPRIWRVFRSLVRAARERRPAAALLVDVPDFNLRLARKLRGLGIPVVYYVSPTVWAWRRYRVRQIARNVDRMLCILPFEEEFYREHGVRARYVGNPVVEQVPPPGPPEGFRRALGLDASRLTLALLPGSRASELHRVLPTMVESAALLRSERPEIQIVVPVAPGLDRAAVEREFAAKGLRPVLVDGRAAEVVGAADVAVVASGTATLETALMLRPMVVVYRMSAISWAIGRLLVKVAFVSLVNLLSRRRLVPELLQGDLRPEAVAAEVRRLWAPGDARSEQLAGLRAIRAQLGSGPTASRVADEVLEVLEQHAKEPGAIAR